MGRACACRACDIPHQCPSRHRIRDPHGLRQPFVPSLAFLWAWCAVLMPRLNGCAVPVLASIRARCALGWPHVVCRAAWVPFGPEGQPFGRSVLFCEGWGWPNEGIVPTDSKFHPTEPQTERPALQISACTSTGFPCSGGSHSQRSPIPPYHARSTLPMGPIWGAGGVPGGVLSLFLSAGGRVLRGMVAALCEMGWFLGDAFASLRPVLLRGRLPAPLFAPYWSRKSQALRITIAVLREV